GSMLTAGDAVTTTQLIYVYAETATTPNCTDENSFTVTIVPGVTVDAPSDVTACDSYVLPVLTSGNYYTGPGGTGSMLNAADVITTTQLIYVYAETGTTPNCTDENSFTVTINTTPVADAPSDVTVCDSYVLPALTVGNYYTGVGGTGSMLTAGDVITTTQLIYVYAETGTTPNCTDENSFTVTVNPTPVADAPSDVTACDSYVLPALAVGNYYTGVGGTGAMIASGTAITTTQLIYVYAETGTIPNCTDENSFTVTINTTPVADAPVDVTMCDSYVLPALTVGNYYTGSGGTGSMLTAGDVITTTQLIYVYAETGTTPNCTDENSFTVTINPTPVADAPSDVTACDSYVLPALAVGNYYTGVGGTGTMIASGTAITTTQLIYVYAETGTTPNCTDENSFTVTINTTPVADAPVDVTMCDSYVLPALTVGNYYTGVGGTGSMLTAGDVITTTQLIYVYAESGTTPNCIDENSFTVTINVTPLADSPADITVCDSYVLPALTVGNYYTGSGGTGSMLTAGDAVTTTQLIYVYAETATTPNCTDENSFTVTVNQTPQLISLTGNGPICEGQDAIFTITGTAGAQVDYTLNSIVQNTIIPASGVATIVVAGATADQIIILSQIQNTTTLCSASLTNTATVSVIALPTASIDAQSNAVCYNRNTTLLFTGTPNATVSFTDGTSIYSVTLDASGLANYTTPNLTVDTTYNITSVSTATTPSCSQIVTDSEIITISPTPTITNVTYTNTICSGTMTDFVVNLNNTTSYVWSATITNIDNTTYVQSGDQTDINQIATLQNGLDLGYITMQITPVLAGSSCAGTTEQFIVTVTPVPVIIDIVESSLSVCSSDTVQVLITGNLANVNYNWSAYLNGVIVNSGITSGTTTGTIDLTVEVADVTQSGDLYFEITPVLGSCTGQMQTSDLITVNPIPGAVVSSPDAAICSGELVADAIDIQIGYPNLVGTTVEWVVQSVTGVSGATSGSASTSPFEIPDTLTTTGNTQGVVVYRVWTVSSTGCRGAYTDFTIYVNPLPQPVLEDGSICVELATGLVFQSHLLDSGIPNTSDYQFTWYYNGNVIGAANQSTYEAEQAGDYYVLVQNTLTNCENISNIVNVTEINSATDFTYTITDAFTDNATISITVIDGNGSFLYQLDDQDLQSSSVFTGVRSGTHQLTVVDQKGCTYLTKEIMIIDYPKFFTPNGDGYNDYWNIFTLRDQPKAKIYIFDRYGKLIKEISPLGEGWDGTFNSKQLPSTDYWFTVEYQENQQSKVFKAHFSLKR
ncbi:T9SS type B sorting domain-containing protein, partial [Flavobacterium jejuense]